MCSIDGAIQQQKPPLGHQGITIQSAISFRLCNSKSTIGRCRIYKMLHKGQIHVKETFCQIGKHHKKKGKCRDEDLCNLKQKKRRDKRLYNLTLAQ